MVVQCKKCGESSLVFNCEIKFCQFCGREYVCDGVDISKILARYDEFIVAINRRNIQMILILLFLAAPIIGGTIFTWGDLIPSNVFTFIALVLFFAILIGLTVIHGYFVDGLLNTEFRDIKKYCTEDRSETF